MAEEQLFTEVERGRQAADIINHPLFVEALEKYKQRLVSEWMASPARDQDGREKLWLMIKTSEAVERHLVELMETGTLASVQLEQKRTLAERLKNWGGQS